MNWLDIAVLLILIINIGLGWFRGLIKSVVNIVSVVAGFICAKLYYMTMYVFLNERFDLLNKVRIGIQDTFQNVQLPELSEVQTLSTDQIVDQLPQSEFLSSLVKQFVESDNFDQIIQTNVDNFSELFSSWLAEKLLTIISMIVIFTLVYLGIRIIGYLLNTVFQLPVLNGVNKLSGFLFGCVKGVFFAMLLVLVVVILSPVFSDFRMVETLETSQIAIYFYKYNIVMYIFEGFI
ncbi:MAG: CvpA family protein [Clostridiales bacterium]|nr:CvpA family protein [Clostridiales bacterium]